MATSITGSAPTPRTGLVVPFSGSVILKSFPAREVTGSAIEITRFEDDPVNKRVVAMTKGVPGMIVLWEGTAYDTIGDWTTANVVTRLHELYHS
jgi:hypothetical protein